MQRTIIHRGIAWLANKGAFNFIGDKTYIKMMYWARLGQYLHLNNPKTFNEKLQWLKLNDRKEIYTRLVDKADVKEYVATTIGNEYIIPTLGVWDCFDQIEFDRLPDQFVLKCTHDSGGIYICKNKKLMNIQKAKDKINMSMDNDYYLHSREWPYKNVKHRIIAEEYISECEGEDIKDYKIHCFNGEPKFILVCSERYSSDGLKEDFFDIDWNHLPVRRVKHPNSLCNIEKPINFDKMLDLARSLAKTAPFLRVDFYNIDGRILFGELTFFPASGFEGFIPSEYDTIFGEMLTLH